MAYVVLFLALIVLPGMFIKLLAQDKEMLENAEFKKKFGVLYEDVKTEDRWTYSYYLWFILRRIVFVSLFINM